MEQNQLIILGCSLVGLILLVLLIKSVCKRCLSVDLTRIPFHQRSNYRVSDNKVTVVVIGDNGTPTREETFDTNLLSETADQVRRVRSLSNA